MVNLKINCIQYIYKKINTLAMILIPFRRYIIVLISVLILRHSPSLTHNIENKFLREVVTYISSLHESFTKEEMPAASMSCKPKHPVIILPGMGSSTLEAWQGMKDFRTSVWGKADMLLHIFSNPLGWETMISLDPTTGLDIPGIKVRPTNGISSSDYILPLYWVWQKIVANLGMLGYDHKNLHVSPFDWRLDISNLEYRDSFFSKLKMEVEMYYKLNNEKVVILGHSLGNVVTMYFFSWVEEKEPGFVDKYIHSLISIAAPFLGTPRSISGLISGESKTSASLLEGSIMDFMIESNIRKRIFNTWGVVRALLPKGGTKFWNGPMIVVNNVEFDVEALVEILKKRQSLNTLEKYILEKINWKHIEEEKEEKFNYKTFFYKIIKKIKSNVKVCYIKIIEFVRKLIMILTKTKTKINRQVFSDKNEIVEKKENLHADIQEILNIKSQNNKGFLINLLWSWKTNLIKYTFDHKKIYNELKENVSNLIGNQKTKPTNTDFDAFKYIDPLKYKLPNAPNLKLFSFYGTGLETERGYIYTVTKDNQLKLNTNINNKNTRNGVIVCDGDGTVPVFSCGYMHYRGWKRKNLNPAGIITVVREYENKFNIRKGLRGGPKTSEHVDILGNHSLMKDVMKICCGEEEEIKDNVISDLENICNEIDAR